MGVYWELQREKCGEKSQETSHDLYKMMKFTNENNGIFSNGMIEWSEKMGDIFTHTLSYTIYPYISHHAIIYHISHHIQPLRFGWDTLW